MAELAADNVLAVLAGEQPATPVSPAAEPVPRHPRAGAAQQLGASARPRPSPARGRTTGRPCELPAPPIRRRRGRRRPQTATTGMPCAAARRATPATALPRKVCASIAPSPVTTRPAPTNAESSPTRSSTTSTPDRRTAPSTFISANPTPPAAPAPGSVSPALPRLWSTAGTGSCTRSDLLVDSGYGTRDRRGHDVRPPREAGLEHGDVGCRGPLLRGEDRRRTRAPRRGLSTSAARTSRVRARRGSMPERSSRASRARAAPPSGRSRPAASSRRAPSAASTPAPPSVLADPPTPTTTSAAPRSSAARTASPRPRLDAVEGREPRRAAAPARRRRPARRAPWPVRRHPRPLTAGDGEGGRDRPASRAAHLDRHGSPSGTHGRRDRPLATVRHGHDDDLRGRDHVQQPQAHGIPDLERGQRTLERVARHDHLRSRAPIHRRAGQRYRCMSGSATMEGAVATWLGSVTRPRAGAGAATGGSARSVGP